MLSRLNICLLTFLVGAVHCIHDPAYTGIKTKSYQRDPQIAQALLQQQQHQQQQQRQQQHFTANQYQFNANYDPINDDATERLSPGMHNQNKLQPQPLQQQQQYHHNNQQPHHYQEHQQQEQPINSHQQERPIYQRNHHERNAPVSSLRLSSSLLKSSLMSTSSNKWNDVENVITKYYTGCPVGFTGQLPYTYDCRRFLNCWNGRGHIQSCAPGTVFNPDTLECDRPDKVVCRTVDQVGESQFDSRGQRTGRLLKAHVEHVPVLCPNGVTGLHPHPTDCTKFLNCANGNVHVLDCGPGTAYSVQLMLCDFKHKVDCSGRDGSGAEISGHGIEATYGGVDTNSNGFDGNYKSGENISCPEGVTSYFPYPFDHGKFIECTYGDTEIENCVPGRMVSISKGYCESANKIDEYDHVSHAITDEYYQYAQSFATCPPGMVGTFLYPYDCSKYLQCSHDQQMTLLSCAPGMVYSHVERDCLPEQQVPPTARVGRRQDWEGQYKAWQSRTQVPPHSTTIDAKCPASASGLYPYPFDYRMYLRCQDGKLIIEVCPAGNVFRLSLKRCDLKERVDGSDRVDFLDTTVSIDQQTFQTIDLPAPVSNEVECPPDFRGPVLHPFDCTAYLRCTKRGRSIEYCPVDEVFSVIRHWCIPKDQVKTYDRVDCSSTSSVQHAVGSQEFIQVDTNSNGFDGNYKSSENIFCPAGVTAYFPYPFDHGKFMNCKDGDTAIQNCVPGEMFSISMRYCESANKIDEYDHVSHAITDKYYQYAQSVVTCPPGMVGTFLYPYDCSKYLQCSHDQQMTLLSCAPGMVYSHVERGCLPEQQVPPTARVGRRQDWEAQFKAWQSRTQVVPPHSTTIVVKCPASGSGLYPYPFDCRKYLRCQNGELMVEVCPAGNFFSLSLKRCDLKERVDASERVAYVGNDVHQTFQTIDFRAPVSNALECPPEFDGIAFHPFDYTAYLRCSNGRRSVEYCPVDTVFSIIRHQCIPTDQVKTFDHVDYSSTLSVQHAVGSQEFSQGESQRRTQSHYSGEVVSCVPGVNGLYPHPFDCTKYFNCRDGRTIIQNCIAGSVFSLSKRLCELKEIVPPSDRVSFVHEYGHELMEEAQGTDFSQTATSSDKISCPPGAIGFHLHPFDCSKYLQCSAGRVVVYTCPIGKVFSLSRKQCIAHDQVAGSDRVGDYIQKESRQEWQSHGIYNPPPPHNQDALVECPSYYNGLLPHPFDCMKFLNCANGVTHIQECGPGTAWNAQLQVCDFEDKVDCSSRQSKRVPTNGVDNSSTVKCPENVSGVQPHPYDCQKFLNCANGVTHIEDCGPGTAWNKAMEVCDFEMNVDCSDRTEYLSHRVSKQFESTDSHTNQWHGAPAKHPAYNHHTPPTLQTIPTNQHHHNYHTQQNISSSSSTNYTHPQDYNNRWTSMHMSRPNVSPARTNSQSHLYPESVNSAQHPVNTKWDDNFASNTSPSEPSTHPQSRDHNSPHAEGSFVSNPNYPQTFRQYSTPLAPFSPIATTSTPSTPTVITSIQYAQPVGSQENSDEIFDNIYGGDLSPVKPKISNTRHDHSRGFQSSTNAWTPIVAHTPNISTSLLTPNQNLLPPYPPISPQFTSQDQNNSPHTDSKDLINLHSEHSSQFPQTELNTFSNTNVKLDEFLSASYHPDASNLYGGLQPPLPTPLQPNLHSNNINVTQQINESNLYGGLQPPIPTPATALSTPDMYLKSPLEPTAPVRPHQSQSEQEETEARVYRIYPAIRNHSSITYLGDPHYSPPYAGVAHSRNASWSNVGRKVLHSESESVSGIKTTSATNILSPPSPIYNRQYYRSSTSADELNKDGGASDPDMQNLPISDALRLLLRPYINRNENVSDQTVAHAESHIMNLAKTTTTPSHFDLSTTASHTTIRPRTHISEHEDDVEFIFTDEQPTLNAGASVVNATKTNLSESHPSFQPNSRDLTQRSYQESERKITLHQEGFHQNHTHMPHPLTPDERSSSDSAYLNHHHRHYHHHQDQHSRDFHSRHPNIPNPFEIVTTKNVVGGNVRESTQLSGVHSEINTRLVAVNKDCQFNCGNDNCVKDFEVCDGVNNCGNRKDEAQCDHLGYEVRLAGGENANSGRVEVKIFGKWGYVCDDKFGLLDADVVCKELGFNLGASEVRGNSFYPPAETNFSFIMDEVDCSGHETSLRECNFKGWGINNCGPDEVLGVVCKVPLLKCPNNYWLCSESKECIPPAFVCDNTPDCADRSDESERVCNSPIEYRLEGGRSANEGRAEVMYRGEWGTVCDDDFGLNEAQVLCNSLGFYGKPKIEKNKFGPGSGPIWLDQVSCLGNESSIDKCNHWTWGEHNCNHTEDVGVRCTAGPKPRQSGLMSAVKGSYASGDKQRSLQDSFATFEDIGLYSGQWQRSSKYVNRNLNHKRCGHFKANLLDEYEHPEERVVNGSMAKRGHHPWQATIRTKGRGGISSHWCGAVLISKRHLLTAAHCLVGYPKGAYFIRMGDHYANIAESSETDSFIENWYIHEKFRDKTHMNNDIALIVLKNPVRFSDYIQPVCLPEKGAPLQVNRLCTISGWGSIKSGISTPSNILRAAQLPILSDETCKQAHVYGNSLTEGMFCAGSMDESVDACDGDSGGPLVCSDADGETLHGIISWGQQCGYANKPGVYVRVEKYIDWIYEKINFSMQQTAN